MKARKRKHALWISLTVLLLTGAAVVPFLVLAGSNDITFTATAYSDAIRFEADRVASLRIRIYDMSETELWDSGLVWADVVDWDRTNEWGERLANGLYVYLVQGWSNADELILAKTGKVALLPGDQVQLQSTPSISNTVVAPPAGTSDEPRYAPQAYSHSGNWTITGDFGVGTDTPVRTADVIGNLYLGDGVGYDSFLVGGREVSQSRINCYYNQDAETMGFSQQVTTGTGRNEVAQMRFTAVTTSSAYISFYTTDGGAKEEQLRITQSGNVGIGTSNAPAKLTVEASSGDLIAAYNGPDRVFVVTNDGTVRADGSVYAASFETGSADVAERINTSEWVEAGDVVEIDPDHPGFFRKATGAYSRRVAGIISTSPGLILGNSSDPLNEEWEDNRPVLAIAGRVPVKVSMENGPIMIGDLLVSSSVQGIAMKGDPAGSIGAVVGKAMQPLNEDEGEIMAQVMLR